MASVIIAGRTPGKITKACIVGFSRCGQTSMQEYLHRGQDWQIDKIECIWDKDMDKIVKELVDNKIEIIAVKRDPVKACWSSYWYFNTESKGMTYEEWLVHKEYVVGYGERNPISCYNYSKWLKRLEKYNPTVYNIEDYIHRDGFPHHSKNSAKGMYQHWKGVMPKMTESQSELTRQLLQVEVLEHTEHSWSVDYI